ncbi:FadR family transcriptional regulator [Occultella glacieicola]|uniref:FadR family transcriptional regulator n=1 Tax=Occultella glacieicola TaxID=2518684 RepID=A0ABY2E4Y5_9MICO|nr:FCD domain-containing protein [Occultella glacieicola]TDE95081.1 FadR family transcriptional regulator [Occultella glacieicola]
MAKANLFETVQAQLLEYITEQGLGPDDPMPSEGELAVQLDVSRGSLREATRSLQSMGVLYAKAGKGLFLQDFSLGPVIRLLPYRMIANGAKLNELLELRAALERGLIPKVAARISEETLARLDAIVDEMVGLEEQGLAFPEQDRLFHRTMYEAIGNDLILDVLDMFWTLMSRMQAELPPLQYHDLADRHRAIVDALRSGGDAVSALDQHFVDIDYRLDRLMRPTD